MPYTEVFDGPDGKLRGTNRDFPQRTHVDFLNRLNKFGDFNEAHKSVEKGGLCWGTNLIRSFINPSETLIITTSCLMCLSMTIRIIAKQTPIST